MKRKQTKPTNEFHTHITFVAHQIFWAILFCNIGCFFFSCSQIWICVAQAISNGLVCVPNIYCIGQLHLRLCLDKKCGKQRQQIKYVLICSFFYISFSFAVFFSVALKRNGKGKKPSNTHFCLFSVCLILRNSYAIIAFSFRLALCVLHFALAIVIFCAMHTDFCNTVGFTKYYRRIIFIWIASCGCFFVCFNFTKSFRLFYFCQL